MTHDYIKALEAFDDGDGYVVQWVKDAIRHALLVADRLQREPSEAMLACLPEHGDSDHFKAMRDAMLAEINLTAGESGECSPFQRRQVHGLL